VDIDKKFEQLTHSKQGSSDETGNGSKTNSQEKDTKGGLDKSFKRRQSTVFANQAKGVLKASVEEVLSALPQQQPLVLNFSVTVQDALKQMSERGLRACISVGDKMWHLAKDQTELQIFDMRDVNAVLVEMICGQDDADHTKFTNIEMLKTLLKVATTPINKIANFSQDNEYTWVELDQPLAAVAQAFAVSARVPVFNNKQFHRIFSATDFLQYLKQTKALDQVPKIKTLSIREWRSEKGYDRQNIEFITERDSLLVAMRKMVLTRYSSLPIFEDSECVGVLSVRDLQALFLFAGQMPTNVFKQPAIEFLTKCRELQGNVGKTKFPFVHIPETASVETAVEKLLTSKVHRIMLTAADGKVTGLVSVTDVAKIVADLLGESVVTEKRVHKESQLPAFLEKSI